MTNSMANNGRAKAPRIWPRLWPAAYVLIVFLLVGTGLWLLDRQAAHLVFFSLIGFSIASGFTIHAWSRGQRWKRRGRRVSLALVGLSLFLGAGVFGRQSFQMEGFFFYLLSGAFSGVVIHYAVAKVFGPLVFGRVWCSWGCWIYMVLDYLPYRTPGRVLPRVWRWGRVGHFTASLGLVLILWFGLGYRHGAEWAATDGLYWFLSGSALYYVLGVGLAVALQNNRAFCKYLCPVSVFLRAGGRLSLLKVAGDRQVCTGCRACDKACPMGIQVSAHTARGTRVLDAECTLCQTCVGVCAKGGLGLSLGLDQCRDGGVGAAPTRHAAMRDAEPTDGPVPSVRRRGIAGPAAQWDSRNASTSGQ